MRSSTPSTPWLMIVFGFCLIALALWWLLSPSDVKSTPIPGEYTALLSNYPSWEEAWSKLPTMQMKPEQLTTETNAHQNPFYVVYYDEKLEQGVFAYRTGSMLMLRSFAKTNIGEVRKVNDSCIGQSIYRLKTALKTPLFVSSVSTAHDGKIELFLSTPYSCSR